MIQESTLKTESRSFVYSKTFSTLISTASSHKILFYDINVKILCLNIRDNLFQAEYVCDQTTAWTRWTTRNMCVWRIIFLWFIELLYWSETNTSLRNISVYTINPDDLNNLEITINIYCYLVNISIGTLFRTLASFVTFTHSSILNSLSLTAFWTYEFTSNNEL